MIDRHGLFELIFGIYDVTKKKLDYSRRRCQREATIRRRTTLFVLADGCESFALDSRRDLGGSGQFSVASGLLDLWWACGDLLLVGRRVVKWNNLA